MEGPYSVQELGTVIVEVIIRMPGAWSSIYIQKKVDGRQDFVRNHVYIKSLWRNGVISDEWGDSHEGDGSTNTICCLRPPYA